MSQRPGAFKGTSADFEASRESRRRRRESRRRALLEEDKKGSFSPFSDLLGGKLGGVLDTISPAVALIRSLSK